MKKKKRTVSRSVSELRPLFRSRGWILEILETLRSRCRRNDTEMRDKRITEESVYTNNEITELAIRVEIHSILEYLTLCPRQTFFCIVSISQIKRCSIGNNHFVKCHLY